MDAEFNQNLRAEVIDQPERERGVPVPGAGNVKAGWPPERAIPGRNSQAAGKLDARVARIVHDHVLRRRPFRRLTPEPASERQTRRSRRRSTQHVIPIL